MIRALVTKAVLILDVDFERASKAEHPSVLMHPGNLRLRVRLWCR